MSEFQKCGCPHCETEIEFDIADSGRESNCPACGKVLKFPPPVGKVIFPTYEIPPIIAQPVAPQPPLLEQIGRGRGADWRNDPATEKQKNKLRFFGCTWDEGITKGQASEAIDECVKTFPEREFSYQNRPATEEQKALLRSYGKRPLHTLTYARARDKIKECENYGWQKDISKSVARWEKQNPLESDDEHFEKPLPAPTSSLGWRIFTGFLKVVGQVSAYIIMAFFAVLVGLLTSGFKSRRRR